MPVIAQASDTHICDVSFCAERRIGHLLRLGVRLERKLHTKQRPMLRLGRQMLCS